MIPLMTLRDAQAGICHAGMKWQSGDRIVALVDREGGDALAGLFGAGVVYEIEPKLAEVGG
jgi:hypothetical protein